MIFVEGSVGLQFNWPSLHSDEVAHPLAKSLTVFCGLSDFPSCVTQRSKSSIQVVSFVVFLQSSQLSAEKTKLAFQGISLKTDKQILKKKTNNESYS